MLRYVLCFCLWIMVSSTCLAQEDEPVFSGEDALLTAETQDRTDSPTHPATAYWKIAATMALTNPESGSHVQMLLPLSDGRQSILSRQATVVGASYREEADGINLWGHWILNGGEKTPRQLIYEYTVQIADGRMEPPVTPFPATHLSPGLKSYLLPSQLIQSDTSAVRTYARRVSRGKTTLNQVARALYDEVARFPAASSGEEKNDAQSVLAARKGGRAGKTRALVALLRAAGIPARMVGGIRLGDTTKKRTTISWVEASIGNVWVSMDPAGGHFAWLPNTYLALYRDDLPILLHTRQVPVEYVFSIRQVTRSEAFAAAPAKSPPQGKRRSGPRFASEHLHTVAAYVEHPIANVVFINDASIPQEVSERILAAAQDNQINVVLLSADFESNYFREHYLQTLISNNVTLIREADLLFINTQDTAGLYALLKQGETGGTLDDLQIVIAGDFSWSVGKVLGATLVRLLKPKELLLAQPASDVSRLWEIARAHVRDGVPLIDAAAQHNLPTVMLTARTVAQLSWWRRQVINLWALAVRSQVPLPALNLILVLPLIAFFLVIIRNVIGLETFGTFSPMLLSLAFLTTGLGWGLVVFAIIVGLGTGLRLVLQRLRLHLVSRVAILIAIVAVSMVGLTVVGAAFGVGALLHAGIFPMVIMANIIENFTNTQLERGTMEALRLTLSTLLVATCSYVGIEETGLKSLVLTFPELLAGVIGVELLLGRWRGLRLLEYVRFYGLARQLEAPRRVETRRLPIGS
jgi:transglutaminase-like putative cysteine protease